MFRVWGESLYRGENINIDINNVYCKYIFICLWYEKRWLFVWFIGKFEKIDERGGRGGEREIVINLKVNNLWCSYLG